MTLDLSVFTGSLRWFEHPTFPTLLLTDGVRHVGEQANAWWLLDHIGLNYLHHPGFSRMDFQVWEILFDEKNEQMIIELQDGDGKKYVSWSFKEKTFPLERLSIWVTDNVLLLPSEW